ncbi:restriction endonuclease subunit S [Vibrio cidicii]|uniref:restriction endonuclease subunit S n=1 Tax=Vibrio TaxID=662 RepID=UPI001CCFA966|nr:restriction endonuclease subunit S [Vibrio vulnificus]MCA0761734.1 restriction endonuclease subunit S [Vibrio vulnificus]
MAGRYKAYPEYKDSGIEWLKEMPSHWELIRAKHLFQRVQRPVRPQDGIVTAFRDGEVTLRSNRRTDGFTNAAKEIGYQGVRKGDLLVHAMDGFAGAIGISDSDGKCSPVCSVCIPRKSHTIEPTYFGYLVRQLAVTDYITSLAKGIRERSTEFRFAEFSSLFLAAPPKEEQQKIANFLDHETAKIDTLITKQEKLIELLKEKRQALISHAVTKGLNPDAPMKDSGVEWLGEVPEHWVVSKLGLYAHKIGSGKTPKGGADVYQESGVLFLRSQNVYDDGLRISGSEATYISDLIHSEMANTSVKPFDVLLNITGGSIGRTCIVPATFCEANVNQHVCILRFAKRNAPYFANVMKSSAIKEQIEVVQVGGNREGLNFEQIANMKVCIPPKDEMNQINKFIQSQLCKFDELVRKADNAIALMKERKTALISAAVTGKIDVRDWQPQGVQG